MYNMKTVVITLFIFTSCSLHLGFSDSPNPIIDNQTVSVPVTEINPPNSSEPPATSTVLPTSSSTVKPTSTPKPNTTSTTPPTSTTPTSTTGSPKTTTTVPTSPTPTPSSTTTLPSTTVKPTSAPPTTPTPSHRRFDGPSFIGGIVLALGLVAIGFVAFKFYKARTELNYHTL